MKYSIAKRFFVNLSLGIFIELFKEKDAVTAGEKKKCGRKCVVSPRHVAFLVRLSKLSKI